ncbi:alkene reductase [Kineosporia sp. NBRC 101677]|uniref:oxidoreductase n=1 Tax=Kineosporia TaxID=49184 RepID=UPI0024A34762|nr:alkene reductase [Kineosporia sp. NBRC 101677]GLY16844.1 alkene reductase [Kineosporia sp. NBRC 101677]
MTTTNSLLQPYDLAGLRLPNRVVMAPMSRVRSTPEGLATASMAAYFAQRATAGLIITDGIQPSRQGQANPNSAGLADQAQADSWKQVTSAVHVNGGRIFGQIMHAGRVGHSDHTGIQPVGPSAVAARNTTVFTSTGPQPAQVPRALSTTEAGQEALVYASAATRAMDAGFDGVELHGANGYLIGQFLSSSANQRTDRYGGSVSGRIRFAVEAAAATADAVGAHRVGIRLSPGAGIWDAVDEDVPQLYGALLGELAKLDLAYVHLTTATDEETLLGLRRAWPGTLIVNPIRSADPAARADRAAADHWLGLGADLISFARAYLANPDLVERLRAGLPLAHADQETFYAGGDQGYLTYPAYQY